MKKGIIIAIAGIVLILLGFFLLKKSPANTNTNSDSNTNSNSNNSLSSKSSRELAMICDPNEQAVLHIHPVLKITINGQNQTLPADVGIDTTAQPPCLHYLHTHDATGIIHVESPVQKDYTLGDFFAVWGKTFSKDQILDNKADDKHRIRMTVNGQDNTDFENLILRDKDNIEIIYEQI